MATLSVPLPAQDQPEQDLLSHTTGVLQVEAMAQLGGIVMLDPEGPSKEQFFFGGIEKCRFKKPVVPGDTLVNSDFSMTESRREAEHSSSCSVQVYQHTM